MYIIELEGEYQLSIVPCNNHSLAYGAQYRTITNVAIRSFHYLAAKGLCMVVIGHYIELNALPLSHYMLLMIFTNRVY